MVDFENILKDADFAPLLMSYVQMSGDTDVLKKYKPYINGPWSFFETVPFDLKNELIHKFHYFPIGFNDIIFNLIKVYFWN